MLFCIYSFLKKQNKKAYTFFLIMAVQNWIGEAII